jgi:hypothetical protein
MTRLVFFLILYNFKASGIDSSMFNKHNFNGITMILVYIDDLIIIDNS